jgi:protein subunit release factor B
LINEDTLAQRLLALGICEQDLLERFVRAQGPGGQKVNKTSSAVYLKHLPSGLEVKVQLFRSQAENRLLARELLAAQLARQQEKARQAEQQRRSKIERQKRKRPRRLKEKILEEKHRQSQKRRLRGKVSREDND